ncbi:MAG: pyridoxal-dependent decarboxylase [Candidatus Bathyarchaeota archaeon]|nr:pyridoxal-dependent decarboxylase [Candidatus Termiticorpusculum sp.]
MNEKKAADVKELFLNPETMNIDQVIDGIQSLHKKFLRYFDVENPRMKNDIHKKYAAILEKEILPEKETSIEKVYEDLSFYAQGILKWNHHGTMININPPATLPSIAATSYVSLYNGNGAQDIACGYLLTTELIVIKMLCQLVGLDYKVAGGIFTFGGKSTNLHALKHGIQRVSPDAIENGIKDEIVAFTSTQGHPCLPEVCGWLGIGEKNCIRIPTNQMGVIDIEILEKEMNCALSEGKKVALITANGGTTIQMTVDPIRKIVELRDKMVKKHQLNYKPRIHVDSVIGWVMLFFKKYDFKTNPLDLLPGALKKIQRQLQKIEDIKYADSFGVDFHKTGFCPYLSSVYITADVSEIYAQGKLKPIPYKELEYGNYSPFQYTLELSRSLNGPIGAYVNLKMLGFAGYQKLIGNLYNTAERLKELLNAHPRFEVINNEDSDGFVTLFVAKEIHNDTSFFHLTNKDVEETRKFALFNHKFYLYIFEQQKLGKCWFTLDYASGYKVLSNGIKIGVLKVYQMSPYFTLEKVEQMVQDLDRLISEFDLIKDSFKVKEVPHKPRSFVFR